MHSFKAPCAAKSSHAQQLHASWGECATSGKAHATAGLGIQVQHQSLDFGHILWESRIVLLILSDGSPARRVMSVVSSREYSQRQVYTSTVLALDDNVLQFLSFLSCVLKVCASWRDSFLLGRQGNAGLHKKCSNEVYL